MKSLADDITPLDIPELNWLGTNYGMVWRRNRPLTPAVKALMAEIRLVEEERVNEEALLSISPPPANLH